MVRTASLAVVLLLAACSDSAGRTETGDAGDLGSTSPLQDRLLEPSQLPGDWKLVRSDADEGTPDPGCSEDLEKALAEPGDVTTYLEGLDGTGPWVFQRLRQEESEEVALQRLSELREVVGRCLEFKSNDQWTATWILPQPANLSNGLLFRYMRDDVLDLTSDIIVIVEGDLSTTIYHSELADTPDGQLTGEIIEAAGDNLQRL